MLLSEIRLSAAGYDFVIFKGEKELIVQIRKCTWKRNSENSLACIGAAGHISLAFTLPKGYMGLSRCLSLAWRNSADMSVIVVL